MSKIRIDLMVDFETLEWIREIQRNKGFKNLSQTIKYISEQYDYMVYEINRLRKRIEKPVESYETVRTEQIKQQQQQEKPLHEQGNPGFFKKYRNINEWFKEKGFVEQEGDKTK